MFKFIHRTKGQSAMEFVILLTAAVLILALLGLPAFKGAFTGYIAENAVKIGGEMVAEAKVDTAKVIDKSDKTFTQSVGGLGGDGFTKKDFGGTGGADVSTHTADSSVNYTD